MTRDKSIDKNRVKPCSIHGEGLQTADWKTLLQNDGRKDCQRPSRKDNLSHCGSKIINSSKCKQNTENNAIQTQTNNLFFW